MTYFWGLRQRNIWPNFLNRRTLCIPHLYFLFGRYPQIFLMIQLSRLWRYLWTLALSRSPLPRFQLSICIWFQGNRPGLVLLHLNVYMKNNDGIWNGSEEWSSQWIFQFKQSERRSLKKISNWKEGAWKKLGVQRDSNPWPPRYRCDALPTELWSLTLGARSIYWFHISREEWNDVRHIWNNSYLNWGCLMKVKYDEVKKVK